MPTSEELDLGLGDIDIQPIPEQKSKKKADAPAKAGAIDPEDDRDNWPVIHIEMEDGKPNFEYVAAHGTKRDGTPFGHELQVMRGVDAKVPPSIIYCLRDAVSDHYVQRRDPMTGQMTMEKQNRSAIPWRMVKGGKYF